MFTDLVEFFEHTLLKLENLRLDTCICMGLGTFTTAHTYCSPDPEPSLYQLAAFETMLEIIRKPTKQDDAPSIIPFSIPPPQGSKG